MTSGITSSAILSPISPIERKKFQRNLLSWILIGVDLSPEGVILLRRSEMMRFIQSLNPNEAARVLKGLLDEDPLLTKKTYDMAVKVAGNVDAETVRGQVFSALDRLGMDDLNGRAGRTQYGYVEPDEAAWELFEEALNPFIDEMRKNQRRALPATAKAYCIGTIEGLLYYRDNSRSDLRDWLEDAPGEYIDTVVEEWKKGSPNDDEIAEVLDVAKGGRL